MSQHYYHLTDATTWKRVFFMLIFAAIGGFVRMLIWLTIVLQIVSIIFTGKSNENVLVFARNLATYTYHILLFLTFNTETYPFPLSPWSVTVNLDIEKS